jgi:hypothetical protein
MDPKGVDTDNTVVTTTILIDSKKGSYETRYYELRLS